MKLLVTNYVFNPTARTVTLTGISVNLDGLLGIFDQTTASQLFVPTNVQLVPSASGSVITLNALAPLAGAQASDALLIYYDDGTRAALETGGNLAAAATALGTPADASWGGSGLASVIAALKAIYAALASPLSVVGTFWQATQPVSAAALPLPAGAATAANQTVSPVLPAGYATAQASVGSTASLVLPARAGGPGVGRVAGEITNMTTTQIFLGGSGVTIATGDLLAGVVGAFASVNTTAAVYGVVASGTATVTTNEEF